MADAALKKHIDLLKKALCSDYRQMYREAGGILPFPFLTPGSKQYDD